MSAIDTEQLFETLSKDDWVEQGGGGSAERGLYTRVLQAVVERGERYNRIPMDRGPFAGKQASSVATALKSAQEGTKTIPAPASFAALRISSKGEKRAEDGSVVQRGVVYIENTAVADEGDEG